MLQDAHSFTQIDSLRHAAMSTPEAVASMSKIETINHFFYNIFLNWGLSEATANFMNVLLLSLILGCILFGILYLFKWLIQFIMNRMNRLSHYPLIKHLLEANMPRSIAMIFPYILLKIAIPIVFLQNSSWLDFLMKAADVYIVCVAISCIMSGVKAFFGLLSDRPNFHGKPVKSYVQIIAILLWIVGGVVILSILTGLSPAKFFAAMGAASAIMMLIFKDTIMGFVASIQVATNDMVRLGDWVTMTKYGADGTVIDIALTSVKVQNFDKTITTIPTYALISDSFQNWRGMSEFGGRRIKRALIIKQNSVKFLNDADLDILSNIDGLADYIAQRRQEIASAKKGRDATSDIAVNNHRLTNSELFRIYSENYLRRHPGINPEMTLMVRQLAPTSEGIPFELYTFANTVVWLQYEAITADIFDHLMAAVPYFDLELFELQTGADLLVSTDHLAAKKLP